MFEWQLMRVSLSLRNKLQTPNRNESGNQGCWLLAYIVIYASDLIDCEIFCGGTSLWIKKMQFKEKQQSRSFS